MHTLLVTLHVIAMIASLALMSSAVLLGLFGKHAAAATATIGMVVTAAGTFAGGLLLLGAPLSIQCALLTGYLAAVSALYVFGFAMGNAKEARLIRSSVQNR